MPRRSRPAADGQGDGRSVLQFFAHEFPCGSRWTSTTRSMRSTVVSSCAFPRTATTNTDFSQVFVFDNEGRFVTAVFVPPSGRAARRSALPEACSRDPAHQPNTEILLGRQPLLRSRGSRCVPPPMASIAMSSALAPTATLRRHVEGLGQHEGGFEAAPRDGKLRRFIGSSTARKAGAGSSGSSRVEAGAEGWTTRFVVANLSKRNARRPTRMSFPAARPKTISSPWKTHLAADRTSSQAAASRFRCSCMRRVWLMWPTRVDAKAFDSRHQFDTFPPPASRLPPASSR